MSIVTIPSSIPGPNTPEPATGKTVKVTDWTEVLDAFEDLERRKHAVAALIRECSFRQRDAWQALPHLCLRLAHLQSLNGGQQAVHLRRCYRYGFWDLSGHGAAIDCANGRFVDASASGAPSLSNEALLRLMRPQPGHGTTPSLDAIAIAEDLGKQIETLHAKLNDRQCLDYGQACSRAAHVYSVEEVYTGRFRQPMPPSPVMDI